MLVVFGVSGHVIWHSCHGGYGVDIIHLFSKCFFLNVRKHRVAFEVRPLKKVIRVNWNIEGFIVLSIVQLCEL